MIRLNGSFAGDLIKHIKTKNNLINELVWTFLDALYSMVEENIAYQLRYVEIPHCTATTGPHHIQFSVRCPVRYFDVPYQLHMHNLKVKPGSTMHLGPSYPLEPAPSIIGNRFLDHWAYMNRENLSNSIQIEKIAESTIMAYIGTIITHWLHEYIR